MHEDAPTHHDTDTPFADKNFFAREKKAEKRPVIDMTKLPTPTEEQREINKNIIQEKKHTERTRLKIEAQKMVDALLVVGKSPEEVVKNLNKDIERWERVIDQAEDNSRELDDAVKMMELRVAERDYLKTLTSNPERMKEVKGAHLQQVEMIKPEPVRVDILKKGLKELPDDAITPLEPMRAIAKKEPATEPVNEAVTEPKRGWFGGLMSRIKSAMDYISPPDAPQRRDISGALNEALMPIKTRGEKERKEHAGIRFGSDSYKDLEAVNKETRGRRAAEEDGRLIQGKANTATYQGGRVDRNVAAVSFAPESMTDASIEHWKKQLDRTITTTLPETKRPEIMKKIADRQRQLAREAEEGSVAAK